MQPLALVKVYVRVKTPTAVGVKTPPDVTPVPLHDPPAPVGENPVRVVGICWLQTEIEIPALTTGNGLTVMIAIAVFTQPVTELVPVTV